ncbi:hypothetical protein KR074_005096 [Drosophila pseudoananassae]|nr:hypothetical protein KR074_005096 [Drosophila pseudoananassae]
MAIVVRLNMLRILLNSCASQTHISRNSHSNVGGSRFPQSLWRQMSSCSSNCDSRDNRSIRDSRDYRDWRGSRNDRSSTGQRSPPNRDEVGESMPPEPFVERRTPFRVLANSSGDNVRMRLGERSLTADEDGMEPKRPYHPMPLEKAVTMRPYNVLRREAQLARTMNSYDNQVLFKPSIPLPVRVFQQSCCIGAYDAIRNPRRMVCESATAPCGEQERNLEGVKSLMAAIAVPVCEPGMDTITPTKWEWTRDKQGNMEADMVQSRTVLQMLRQAIFRAVSDKGTPSKLRSKTSTKLEWNGLRPCRKNTDPFGMDRINDTDDRVRIYQMVIYCSRRGTRRISEVTGGSNSTNTTRTRSITSNCLSKHSGSPNRSGLINRIRRNICRGGTKMMSFPPKHNQRLERIPLWNVRRATQQLPARRNIVKDEQKRLDKLKAAKVHLKVLQDSKRHKSAGISSTPIAIPVSSLEKTQSPFGGSQLWKPDKHLASDKVKVVTDEKEDKNKRLISEDRETKDPTDLAPN